MAIRKYGESAFLVEPLFIAIAYDALLEAERALISQWETLAPHGYNLSPGGEGCFGIKRSAATRALMSASKLGKPRSAETRARLSKAKIGISQNVGERNGGAKLSADDARRIRAGLDGKRGTQRRLAREFGVSFTAVWKIAHGLKWAAS